MKEEPTIQDWINKMARLVRYRMKARELNAQSLAKLSGLQEETIRKIVDAEISTTHKMRTMLEGPLGCSLEFVEPDKR